jgi:hypothetical protein
MSDVNNALNCWMTGRKNEALLMMEKAALSGSVLAKQNLFGFYLELGDEKNLSRLANQLIKEDLSGNINVGLALVEYLKRIGNYTLAHKKQREITGFLILSEHGLQLQISDG